MKIEFGSYWQNTKNERIKIHQIKYRRDQNHYIVYKYIKSGYQQGLKKDRFLVHFKPLRGYNSPLWRVIND